MQAIPFEGRVEAVDVPPNLKPLASVAGRSSRDVWMLATEGPLLHWDGASTTSLGTPECFVDSCCGHVFDCKHSPAHSSRRDPAPGADELYDRAVARAELDVILDGMPLDLRAVFVLFELEQATLAEIAVMLEVPPGTVASRLRRAREHFQERARRLVAKGTSS